MQITFDEDARLRGLINNIYDFPTKGVVFRDIQPLLASADAFDLSIIKMVEWVEATHSKPPKAVVGIDARGFIFASAIAHMIGSGLIMARKEGKLPPMSQLEKETYALEYGHAVLEVSGKMVQSGADYLVVDDVLATGGTALAACRLIERLGGKVTACLFLTELSYLQGRLTLIPRKVAAVLDYKTST